MIFLTKCVSIIRVSNLLRFFGILLVLGFFWVRLYGQVDSRDLSSERDYRYRLMQQRMLELSQRMGKVSGTEPIELIDRNESLTPPRPKTAAQKSYEALPGPPVEPLSLPEDNSEWDKPVVYQSEVSRVAPTNQQIRGDYYFMPMIGFALTSYTTYAFVESNQKFRDELDGEWGNSIALTGGKRWENLMTYYRIAYQHQTYKNDSFSSGISTIHAKAHGMEESYSFGFGGGYSVPLMKQLSTIGTLGIGAAWRRNSFNSDLYFKSTSVAPGGGSNTTQTQFASYSDFQSSMVFTYDLALGFEYLVAENFTAYFGYRMFGLTSNKEFEGSFQHLFELGAGANF